MGEHGSGEPLVAAEGLARSFMQGGRKIEAVMPASWKIDAKTHTAIMGPSGSGKSALLHLIAGIDIPTAGEISWPALGPRQDLRPAKLSIAFQAPTLVPFLSAVENVALPLIILGNTRGAFDAAAEALALFGLEALAGKLPEELSGGQAQRIALARAIVSRPRLVLADEPTSQLDQVAGAATIQTLLEWTDTVGITLIVATHDPAIAERFDAIWRMDHGRLLGSQGGLA